MNPLLETSVLPAFDKIEHSHIQEAIKTLIEQARLAITQEASSHEVASWENTVEKIDDRLDQLSKAWSVAGHLNSVVNTPELRQAYNDTLPLVSEFWTWVGLHKGLYQRYKDLHESPAFTTLTDPQQRVITQGLKQFTLSGVDLEEEQAMRFAEISARKAELTQKFSENIMDATDEYALYINDKERLAGIPSDVLAAFEAAAQADKKTGYKISLHIPSYLPVMQYAHDRELRAELYKAYATRASEQGNSQYDNSGIILELLQLRKETATLLGYANFADMQLTMRMADNPQQVIDFLELLADKSLPFARKDMETLKEFAAQQLNLTDLQPWDTAFVSEILRQKNYAYSEHDIKQYFTEPKVIAGLFEIIETLFKVKLTTITAATWHPHVRVIRVTKPDDSLVGHLYFDLYARPGKQGGAWVDQERSRRIRNEQTQHPIAFLTCNFSAPNGDKPALLSHDDVITLFHEMGHALHLILSEVKELGSSPFASVEWDAIELPSQFMENFCWEWPVVSAMTAHVDTGASIPKELYDKLFAAKNFQSGMQLVRQLEFSLFDMLLHVQAPVDSIESMHALLGKIRNKVAVIHPPAWHRFAHSFSHIFAGGYSAGYYSYKWAEVLSADAYAAFEEEMQARGATSTLEATEAGARYHQEILSVGGKRPAAQSFVAFRGREPKIDALLRHSGLA